MRERESRGTVENRHDSREAAPGLVEVMSHGTGSLKTRIVLPRYWNRRRAPAYIWNRDGQNMVVDTVTKSSECRNWDPNLVVQNEKIEKKRLRIDKKKACYQANKEAQDKMPQFTQLLWQILSNGGSSARSQVTSSNGNRCINFSWCPDPSIDAFGPQV